MGEEHFSNFNLSTLITIYHILLFIVFFFVNNIIQYENTLIDENKCFLQ